MIDIKALANAGAFCFVFHARDIDPLTLPRRGIIQMQKAACIFIILLLFSRRSVRRTRWSAVNGF
jgi:hypothetical protein